MFPLHSGYREPVYPWNFVHVNTRFESVITLSSKGLLNDDGSSFRVIRQPGPVTAYTDKHPVYVTVNSPSGLGLTEELFPEINTLSG